ncbi:MAG: hypothetical protein AVDCRST_MAG59-3434, partial [uncultured Thermomicrobiales bacterium]
GTDRRYRRAGVQGGPRQAAGGGAGTGRRGAQLETGAGGQFGRRPGRPHPRLGGRDPPGFQQHAERARPRRGVCERGGDAGRTGPPPRRRRRAPRRAGAADHGRGSGSRALARRPRAAAGPLDAGLQLRPRPRAPGPYRADAAALRGARL